MSNLTGKMVFITGATAGIGKACAYAFAEEGCNLLLSARRINLLNEVAEDIRSKYKIRVHALKLDVRNREEVQHTVNSLPRELKEIDILINNAGLAKGLAKLHEDDPNNWEEMIDTNVKGLLYVTRAVVPLMVKRNKGHVINLGSTAGHVAYPNGSVYCSTKFAVRALTDSLRQELIDKNIRVSSVDPGMVETDFNITRFNGDEARAKKVYEGLEPLTAEDVAETILFVASRPERVSIQQVIITPTAQANIYVINRKKDS